MKKLLSVVMMISVLGLSAQTNQNEERIKRDVEVAENVLSTLMQQHMEKRTSFWMGEVKGTYTPGFGVTLRVPYENWLIGAVGSTAPAAWGGSSRGESYSIYSTDGLAVINRGDCDDCDEKNTEKNKAKSKGNDATKRDSARSAYGNKLLEASKIFLADYGDLIGLEPNEKILITTKSERSNYNFNFSFAGDPDLKSPKRKVISVEALKSDLTAYKQNKISRDQVFAKFKVVNSELNAEASPDIELLSTILSRLYRSDLSKTYFTENAPYYERMRDFGVTFYMQVYSSNEAGYKRFNMPTLDLSDLNQEERDKKVIELYPAFEKDLKENMLEYGRTLNSLKDDELLILDVTLTRCKGCNIPTTVEFSVKASVLKEFGSGKLSKDAALTKINVKKGTLQ